MIKRRQFFQLVGSLGLALVIPRVAKAQVVSLKGCILNNAVSPYHQTISAASDWVRMDTSKWISGLSIQIGCKVAFDLSSKIPDAVTIQTVVARPEYDHWWMSLNEPDLGSPSLTPQQAVDIFKAQVDAVLPLDSNAKFALSCGTYLNPVYTPNAWGQQLWALVPRGSYRQAVDAFHTHWYDYGLNHPELNIYLKNLQTFWANDTTGFHTRELWLSEIGAFTQADGSVNPTPTHIQDLCNKHGLNRWAWYAQYATAGYMCLEDANGLTLTGQEYNAL